MAVTLTGKIADIMDRPVEDLTSAVVKHPTYQVGEVGALATSAPREVEVAEDGTFSVTVNPGKGWLHLTGSGWTESVGFVASSGMSLFIEAVANYDASPIYDLLRDLIDALGGTTEAELQALVEQAKMWADKAAQAQANKDTWYKGSLTTAVPLLDLQPGRYGIFSKAVVDGMGLPGGASTGMLVVQWLDGNGLYRRFVWESDAAGGYEMWRAVSYNKSNPVFSQANTPYVGKPLTAETVLTDLSPGRYPVASRAVAEALGLPNPGMGVLDVSWLGSKAYQRFDWMTGVNPFCHYRASVYNGSLSNAVWEQLHPVTVAESDPTSVATKSAINALLATVDPTVDFAEKRTELVAGMKSRLGTVSTGGKGAVALVFDHGTTAFRDWVWPALKQRGLTGTLALCPEVHLDPAKADSRDQATIDELKAMVADGLAIASHSGDHQGATGWVDIHRQIVDSRATLETRLGTTVDSWVQPGYGLATGNYDGFGTGQTAEVYSSTVAGRLLQKTYPVITGYVGADDVTHYTGALPVGAQRSLFETKDSIVRVREFIQRAADEGSKHITFIHPYAILDSSDSYANKADYLALLDLIVSLRDAGKLAVLTLPQLAIAA